MEIESNKLYPTGAPELEVIAKRQTLAQWRSEGKGPPYTKSGSRILYSGKDLIDWLKAQRVEPSAA
ncbi:helix-turn-helix domain-containing protein [uncultured Ruegeria sp.]|uniref:helix-turn-helix domain-containing protein n=1 Tax=uncultured Ruegeria sp. TaxID=259304 RepID=UPI0026226B06|nr:helix-turn-helix domain-containing protein [uncultured Ruegeria sp.]